ncbi:MAG: glycosyltransferase [Actinomycetes bacterium]
MKALIVTNMWPSAENPSAGIFVSDQVNSLRSAGVDVDVFSFNGGTPAAYAGAAMRLTAKSAQKWDVVHSHFGLSAWVGRTARARIHAVTFHGTDLTHPRSRRISLAALRFTDLCAAVSKDLAQTIPTSQAKWPVEVLPCGVALDRFTPGSKADARQQLGISPTERVLLLPSDPARPEKHSDRAEALATAVGARLITLGGVEPSDVSVRIQAADLVVIPSEREGFGLALLEALACETPVLTTPVGIAAHATAGLSGGRALDWDLAAWTSAAVELMELEAPSGGRLSAQRWSSDACAKDVIAAWERALAR